MAYPTTDMTDELDAVEAANAARARYSESEPYQAYLAGQYQKWHDLVYPLAGDQWASDAALRPGKIHLTSNWTRPAIEVGSRLEALLPRIAIPTVGMDDNERNRAEAAEQLILTWLDVSEWETWLHTLSTTKRIYGKGIIKVYWDEKDKRPVIRVIENPAHLRIGWGASDFSTIDWVIYEYAVSAAEVMRRWPDVQVEIPRNPSQPIRIIQNTDHADPLGQRIMPNQPNPQMQVAPRTVSQYEQRQVPVWDYWYREPDGKVCNAIIVADTCVEGPTKHPEMPDLPYIVVENMHEPSSPEGVSEVDLIADIQIEHNRLLAHGLQHVADDTDPSWQYKGTDGASMPPGIVPKAGEIIDVGNGDVNLIPKSVNIPPIVELDNLLWDDFHKRSGLPEILFGNSGSDISGRALAVQVESAINRLDPRRKLLYRGLKQLIRFMVYMGIKKNPMITAGVDPETGEPQKIGVRAFLEGMTRWNIVAPEVTPRDSIENTQNVINKIQARVSSIRSGMDEIGVDSPESEVSLIKEEQRDVYLSPQQAQAIAAVFPMIQQMIQMQQQMQMQEQMNQVSPPVPPAGMSAVAQSQVAQNGLQQQQAAAQPGYFPDQNTPQPMTQAGSPPPSGGQQPATTTLIRGGKALNQLAFQSGGQGAAGPVGG